MKNYFNYFTEVEEYFARRRGRNLLVSPLDWCLIELWRESAIPLDVVLRGIDRSFQAAERTQKRPPSSLSYCHPAVLEAHQEYLRTRLGAGEEPQAEPLEEEPLRRYLEELEGKLRSLEGEGFARAARRVAALREDYLRGTTRDCRQLDRDLGEVGRMLGEVLLAQMSREEVKQLRQEVRREMKIYRKRLSREMYQRLEASYLGRRVRSRFGLPEFTLLEVESS